MTEADEREGAALGMFEPGKGFTPRNHESGRWPANVVTDGSDEVVGAFPSAGGQQGRAKIGGKKKNSVYGDFNTNKTTNPEPRGDFGSAARFFYSAKASRQDRNGSRHPTVKPISLMEWLATLITPPGGTVLDPFAGSGTTGVAAINKGFRVILCEREAEYAADIQNRFAGVQSEPAGPGRRISRIFADEKGIKGGRLDKPLVSASKVARFHAWNAKACELQAFLDMRVA